MKHIAERSTEPYLETATPKNIIVSLKQQENSYSINLRSIFQDIYRHL